MIRQEFEALAIRGNGEITQPLYDAIERYYTSDNNYHEQHGGKNESKQDFVKRVFGGKVNTPRTILKKTIAEAVKENSWCLRDINVSKERYDKMNACIEEHYTWLAKQQYL